MPRDDEPMDLDDTPRPARRRRQQEPAGMPVWVWLAVAASLLVTVVIGVYTTYLVFAAKKSHDVAVEKKADMSVAEFLVQTPTTPTVLHGVIGLGDYWNFKYSSSETYYSFYFGTPGERGLDLWARRDSAVGKQLFELCKDADNHRVTLSVHRVGPDGAPTPPGTAGTVILSVID